MPVPLKAHGRPRCPTRYSGSAWRGARSRSAHGWRTGGARESVHPLAHGPGKDRTSPLTVPLCAATTRVGNTPLRGTTGGDRRKAYRSCHQSVELRRSHSRGGPPPPEFKWSAKRGATSRWAVRGQSGAVRADGLADRPGRHHTRSPRRLRTGVVDPQTGPIRLSAALGGLPAWD